MRAEKHYQRRMAWTDTISKIGPMVGLMATLIPLGPGIVALGMGNTAKLSASLGIAFDATVCGLVCAVVALVISKIRSGWYSEYLSSLEALMTCLLDKAKVAREEAVVLPHGYTGTGKASDGAAAGEGGVPDGGKEPGGGLAFEGETAKEGNGSSKVKTGDVDGAVEPEVDGVPVEQAKG